MPFHVDLLEFPYRGSYFRCAGGDKDGASSLSARGLCEAPRPPGPPASCPRRTPGICSCTDHWLSGMAGFRQGATDQQAFVRCIPHATCLRAARPPRYVSTMCTMKGQAVSTRGSQGLVIDKSVLILLLATQIGHFHQRLVQL